MFILDCPPDEAMPWHLDPLMGFPCPASGAALETYLELASAAHVAGHHAEQATAWPRWQDHQRRRERLAQP